jgi:hypothetical protein
MGKRINVGLVLLALLLPGWCFNADAAQWDLATLMNQLAGRDSGQASFTERKYLGVLDKPIEQSGTLAFAPGHLEKVTQRPYLERMSVNGDELVIESGPHRSRRQMSLQRYPPLQGFIEGIRATLTGDLDTLRAFYRIALHGSPDAWVLEMLPSQPDMAAVVRLVRIRGVGDRINSIEVVQENGDRSVMTITEENRR